MGAQSLGKLQRYGLRNARPQVAVIPWITRYIGRYFDAIKAF